MRVIDTHSHLYAEKFDEDYPLVVERALRAGVSSIVLPAIDWDTMDRLESFCNQHPGLCYPMIGLHPEEVKADYVKVIDKMKKRMEERPSYYIGVGEIGLDFYWDETFREQQLHAFELQLMWAIERNLPVVIHSRKAHREMVDIIGKYKDKGPKGIFHCFGGTMEEAYELLQFENFCLGIGGVLTFKRSTLPSVIKEIPLERLVVETDSPYLAPVPHRGKRNESAFVVDTLRYMAACKNITIEEAAEKTTANAERLFPALKGQ